MEYREKRQNRKLSALIYSKAAAMVEARAFREDTVVLKVNPAYTSLIAKVKYMKLKNLSIHCAAAYVIGRRGDGIFGKTAILSQPSCTKNTEEPLENRLYPRKKGGFFLLPGGSACMG